MDDQTKIPKVVFVSGVGRSGTTWIAEMLNYGKRFRYVFEPFHPFMQVFPEYHHMRYVREQERDPVMVESIRKLFYDDFENAWTDHYSGPDAKSCDNRLIKGIRSNLMVPWLSWMYPENRFIVVLRHPCATAVSRIKYSELIGEWAFLDIKRDLFGQAELVGDYLQPFKNAEPWPTSKDWFESTVVEWCATHYVLLKFADRSNIMFTYYENMVNNPISELLRLWLFLTGQKYFGGDLPSLPSDLMPPLSVVDRPSAQDNPGYSAMTRHLNPFTNWMEHVPREQLDYAGGMIELFGLGQLYDVDTPIPLNSKFTR